MSIYRTQPHPDGRIRITRNGKVRGFLVERADGRWQASYKFKSGTIKAVAHSRLSAFQDIVAEVAERRGEV
jgi:hypothetical protein